MEITGIFKGRGGISLKGQAYVILSIIFIIIVAIFAVINVRPVEVNYLFTTGNSPLIIVILCSVLMGGLITSAAGTVKFFKMQREIKALKLEISQYEIVSEMNPKVGLDVLEISNDLEK